MEKEVLFENKKGEKLSGYLHIPKGRYKYGVILSHCFTCSKHVGIIRKMCDYLAQSFLVLRFDFSGNGESEGKFEEATYSKELEDYDSAIKFLKMQGVKSVGSLGHSMGAAVSIIGGIKSKEVKSLVVLGADSSTQGIERLFDEKTLNDIKSKGKCSLTMFGKKITLTKDFFDDAKKYSVSETLKSSKKPILIVHGEKDEVINVDNARRIYFYANEPKEIEIIEGGNHMFTNHTEQVFPLAMNWFKKYLMD